MSTVIAKYSLDQIKKLKRVTDNILKASGAPNLATGVEAITKFANNISQHQTVVNAWAAAMNSGFAEAGGYDTLLKIITQLQKPEFVMAMRDVGKLMVSIVSLADPFSEPNQAFWEGFITALFTGGSF